jgi:hypothetical protein
LGDYFKMANDYAKQAIDYVKGVCDTFGPRRACSEEERRAADDLKSKLGFTDEILYQKFKARPGLYPQGLVKMAIGIAIFGCIFMLLDFPLLNFPFSIITSLTAVLGLVIFFTSLFLMKEWFGFPFKQKESQNVLGIIRPRNIQKEPIAGKMKVIIAGHTDSANQMKITKFEDNIVKVTASALIWIVLTILLGLLKFIFLLTPVPVSLFQNEVVNITYFDIIWILISIPGIPLTLFVGYCYTGNTLVPGANDNLIVIGLALALGKYFTQNNHRLNNVELWVGGFGCEEIGERGAYAFVKLHGEKGDLDNAYGVIPDSCGAGSTIAILTQEKMHFVKHSPEVYNRLWKGYEQYCKERNNQDCISCKVEALPFAASDGGRFSLKGYKAASMIAYDGKLLKPVNWHAVTDTPENLDPKVVEAMFELLKNFILSLENDLQNNLIIE